MRNLETYLKESLLKHIALELKDKDIIYEKYGEYDGCEELSKYIVNKLKNTKCNSLHISYNEVKHINNIVFDNLYIIFTESEQNVADYLIPSKNDIQVLQYYNLNNNYKTYSIINKNTNRFENCLISVNAFLFRNMKLISLLEHELTHLFDDYKIQSTGLALFFDIFNNESYKRTKEYNQHKHPLRANQLENALYLMNSFEKNAFIAQLCSEIRELKETDKYYKNGKLDANKIYNIIKGFDIYIKHI